MYKDYQENNAVLEGMRLMVQTPLTKVNASPTRSRIFLLQAKDLS